MMYGDDDMKRAIESARQVALSNIHDLDGYLSPEEFYQKVLIHAVAEHNRKANGLPPLAEVKSAVPTVKICRARRFVLDRREDATGTSGTGTVAEGVEFSNGKAALHWFSHYGAVNVYDSMLVTTAIHGHGGKTQVVWLDREKP